MGWRRKDAKQEMLEVAVNAAGAGHDLTGFSEAEGQTQALRGWRAMCRRCGQVVWVRYDGVTYNMLEDACVRERHGR